MSEDTIWKPMQREFKRLSLWRVESNCTPGIPDVHFIGKHSYDQSGTSGWIENKFVKTLMEPIKFRPAQPKWIADYVHSGGNCFILVKTQTRKFYLFQGAEINIIKNKSILELAKDNAITMRSYLHANPWKDIESDIIISCL